MLLVVHVARAAAVGCVPFPVRPNVTFTVPCTSSDLTSEPIGNGDDDCELCKIELFDTTGFDRKHGGEVAGAAVVGMLVV